MSAYSAYSINWLARKIVCNKNQIKCLCCDDNQTTACDIWTIAITFFIYILCFINVRNLSLFQIFCCSSFCCNKLQQKCSCINLFLFRYDRCCAICTCTSTYILLKILLYWKQIHKENMNLSDSYFHFFFLITKLLKY